MKRLELLEFEGFPWFPNWIRIFLTRLIVVMHKLLKSSDDLVPLIKKKLNYSNNNTIVDLCSGSGALMIVVYKSLAKEHGATNLKLILTDLYPSFDLLSEINHLTTPSLSNHPSPVNASNVSPG
jgi:hypothetical protein